MIRRPWPSMLRTIYGDHERYKQDILERIPGVLFRRRRRAPRQGRLLLDHGPHGRRAQRRGHRLGTIEIESALVGHPSWPRPRSSGGRMSIKGQAVVCLRHAEERASAVAGIARTSCASTWPRRSARSRRPDDIRFTDALPKTRSGKIMRRLLRELARKGEVKGDTTTLEDYRRDRAIGCGAREGRRVITPCLAGAGI